MGILDYAPEEFEYVDYRPALNQSFLEFGLVAGAKAKQMYNKFKYAPKDRTGGRNNKTASSLKGGKAGKAGKSGKSSGTSGGGDESLPMYEPRPPKYAPPKPTRSSKEWKGVSKKTAPPVPPKLTGSVKLNNRMQQPKQFGPAPIPPASKKGQPPAYSAPAKPPRNRMQAPPVSTTAPPKPPRNREAPPKPPRNREAPPQKSGSQALADAKALIAKGQRQLDAANISKGKSPKGPSKKAKFQKLL